MDNIEIKNISKIYNQRIKALDEITFNISPGIFGLLGHNGAGKSTLMKAIATLVRPTNGTIMVNGYDTVENAKEVRSLIGYLPQELVMYENLSVYDFIDYMSRLKGIKTKSSIIETLEKVDMEGYKNRKIGNLSGGMKRRVGIAQALIGEPPILIVDEPTAGLDPEERVRFRNVLSNYAGSGNTVVLSTHIVEDVYQLCNKLAVLRNGKLFFCGTPDKMLMQIKDKVKVIKGLSQIEVNELQGTVVIISTSFKEQGIDVRIVDYADIYNQNNVEATLEDAYVYCMGGKKNE